MDTTTSSAHNTLQPIPVIRDANEVGGCSCGAKFYSTESIDDHECPLPLPGPLPRVDVDVGRVANSLAIFALLDAAARVYADVVLFESVEPGTADAVRAWAADRGHVTRERIVGKKYTGPLDPYVSLLVGRVVVIHARNLTADELAADAETAA